MSLDETQAVIGKTCPQFSPYPLNQICYWIFKWCPSLPTALLDLFNNWWCCSITVEKRSDPFDSHGSWRKEPQGSYQLSTYYCLDLVCWQIVYGCLEEPLAHLYAWSPMAIWTLWYRIHSYQVHLASWSSMRSCLHCYMKLTGNNDCWQRASWTLLLPTVVYNMT